jgi:hypothetical protein
MVAVEILDSVLSFAIYSFVEILNDLHARRPRFFEVRIHIVYEHGQRLRPNASLHGALSTLPRLGEHNPGVAEMHLRALGRIAVAIMLDESEGASEPIDRLGNVLIDEMRKNNVGGHGTILHNVSL